MIINNPTKQDCSFNVWYVITVVAYMVLTNIDQLAKYFIWLKPLPVLLMVLKIHSVREANRSVRLIEAGLFFGMIGDILLEISGPKTYFYIGVGTFFVGHLSYIVAFISAVQFLQTQTSTRSSVFFAGVYAAIVACGVIANLYFIWDNIETMEKVGFSIYSACVGSMSISAFYFSLKARYDSNLKFASVAIFLGGLIFMISDITLSEKQENNKIDKNTKNILGYVVGVTYWLGQLLIA